MTHWGNSFPGNELPADNTEGGEWIEHDGKGMPVDGEAVVDVMFPDGEVVTAHKAGFWDYSDRNSSNWVVPQWGNSGSRIIAYRVVKP